jgi:hypothetical protein
VHLRFLVLTLIAFVLFVLMASDTRAQGAATAADVVVHVADLPSSALSEFDFWPGPGSPGGKMVGTPQTGGDLDPPPEDDPHVMIPVQVRPATRYRLWVHMYVGKPKGVSKANKVWVQFTNASDAGKDVLKPRSADFLTVEGPEKEGWVWVGSERLVSFRAGDSTIRVQAGMEGVGFDQIVLSPSTFIDRPPTTAIVAKTR